MAAFFYIIRVVKGQAAANMVSEFPPHLPAMVKVACRRAAVEETIIDWRTSGGKCKI